MKRVFLTLAFAIFAVTVWADETPQKPSFAGFVSNGFWDNWEISAGMGAGTALSNGKNLSTFDNRLGFEGNFSVTKWIHPVVGLRAQLQGGRFSNYDPNAGKMIWPYMFAHIDAMVNLSNWIGGYREDRTYYAVPFIGFGYMAANISDKSHRDNNSGTHQSFACSYGLLNKFRMSPSVDFNIELKGLMVPSRISPVQMSGRFLSGFSATAGFTYRFNKRGWERCGAGYKADDIRAFQDAVATDNAALEAAAAENARLTEQLNTVTAEVAAANTAKESAEKAAANNQKSTCSESLILFDYGMSVLTPQEKTRLSLLAEKIKKGAKDAVYQIAGHADQQTGTAAGNKRVAENRAKRVYDFLVSKGVNPKQLNYEGKGNTPDPFKEEQAANRAVIIK